jgi:hypothetical protein
MKKQPTDKELRARGYMTPDEFVDRLIPGLMTYLQGNMGESLCHPEDLIGDTLSYIETAYIVISDFGAGPAKTPNQMTIEALIKAKVRAMK